VAFRKSFGDRTPIKTGKQEHTGSGTERADRRRNRYNETAMKTRSVSLSIRGFAGSTDVLTQTLGRQPSSSGLKGETVRRGILQTLKRSYITYDQSFGSEALWDHVILELIDSLGGVASVRAAVAQLRPEFVQIDISVPVRHSEEQEDRYVSCEVLRVLAEIGADLTFSFI
jgi:hypothetical protein